MRVESDSMVIKVTLIGERQARVGFRFFFEGTADLCAECKVRKVCLGNLEPGRLYEVYKVSKKRFPCVLHSEDAVLVEVKEPPVEAAVQARIAVDNALMTYVKSDCVNAACEYWEKCFPAGLVGGDRCKVLGVKGSLMCPLKAQLLLVSLQRQPEVS